MKKDVHPFRAGFDEIDCSMMIQKLKVIPATRDPIAPASDFMAELTDR